jgi:methyltransferase (TIGR00027 family)
VDLTIQRTANNASADFGRFFNRKGGRKIVQDRTASRTALATAYLRAAHQLLDAEPLILKDPVALVLLGPDAEKRIKESVERYSSPQAKALRAHVVLRSRYAEDRLESSMQRGIRRYILVGAGFDTFAIRRPAWATHLRIVEVDHPDTQRLKRGKLSQAGIPVPGNVVFAGVDFENESLDGGLIRNGIRNDEPTFFSWLGVTMYLTEPAIDATLKCMASYPAGSEAVITFRQPPSVQSSASSQLADRVSEAGEPFVSHFTPEKFRGKLIEAGFVKVEFLTPARSARYFHGKENSLPNPERIAIASAML